MKKDIEFSNDFYIHLLETIKANGYQFKFYDELLSNQKYVILRHDIDFSLNQAMKMAVNEHINDVKSTYFFLLTSNFYNLHSKESTQILKKIKSLGHDIGLHFDETKYSGCTIDQLVIEARKEAETLTNIVGEKINKISMHRPSAKLLESNVSFGEDFINTYSIMFFKDIKYISDSRMNWKENPLDVISSNKYTKIQILTHPIWYNIKSEQPKDILMKFIRDASKELYSNIEQNITNLNDLLGINEILSEVNDNDKLPNEIK